MNRRWLATAGLVSALGLTGLAFLLPSRARDALVQRSRLLAEDLVLAVEDALDVFGEETA